MCPRPRASWGGKTPLGGNLKDAFLWYLRVCVCILAISRVCWRVRFKRGSFLGVWRAVAAFRAGSLDCRVTVCGCVSCGVAVASRGWLWLHFVRGRCSSAWRSVVAWRCALIRLAADCMRLLQFATDCNRLYEIVTNCSFLDAKLR